MIGCTELLKFSPDPENHKAGLLNFSLILKNALTIRPNTDILGGSVKQIFDLDKRLVSVGFRGVLHRGWGVRYLILTKDCYVLGTKLLYIEGGGADI